jgi:peptide/nickel transport system substrate-binding protein
MPAEALTTPAPLENSPLNSTPIGTGPYKFVEWRKGATMTLVANEDYFAGAPSIKKITIVFAEDDNTRAQQMRAGDLDATVLPRWPAPSRAASLRWCTTAVPTTARSPCPRATR